MSISFFFFPPLIRCFSSYDDMSLKRRVTCPLVRSKSFHLCSTEGKSPLLDTRTCATPWRLSCVSNYWASLFGLFSLKHKPHHCHCRPLLANCCSLYHATIQIRALPNISPVSFVCPTLILCVFLQFAFAHVAMLSC